MNTESLEFFRELLSKVPGSVFAYHSTPDGTARMLYTSEGGAQLYERPLEDLKKRGISPDDIHPDDRAGFLQATDESARNLTPFRWTGRHLFPGDRVKWIRFASMPERQPDGSVVWFGTAFDVTEEVESQRQARSLLAEQAHQRALFEAVIDNLPVAVTVVTERGELPVYNKMCGVLFGQIDRLESPEVLHEGYGVFEPDRVTLVAPERMSHVRALKGEVVEDDDQFLRSPHRPEGVMLRTSARPLRLPDGTLAALSVARDVTQQRELEDEVRQRNRQLAASEEEKSQLVARLRLAVDELSNPILEVWDDVLAMPIIGVVDSRRTADMAQRLLAEVSRTQAQSVIIDLTGVEVVDTKTADNLIKLVRKVELIGARCVLTGIRPSVAETVVEIGVEFAGLTTLRNLKHGLQEALGLGAKRSRLRAASESEGDEPRPRRRRQKAD